MIQEQTSAVLSALRTIANERKGLEALEEAIRTAGEGGLGARENLLADLRVIGGDCILGNGIGK